jgi:RNA polymerase sigma-70 factor (ECF subfamily)
MDRTLLDKAQAGDRAAMEAVLAELAPQVHRFGLRMCRNATDADDVLQDTLLQIATHLPEFEGRSALSSWVFTLARTACARRRRGLKNRPAASTDALPDRSDDAPAPDAVLETNQLAAALSSALDGLSDEHREVIVLRDIEGLTAPEAAEALSISVDALKSRLHRARSALRDAMKPWLERTAPPPSPGCPEVATLWSRKIEGELRAEDCKAMEQHLEACPSCAAACDALRTVLSACAREGQGPVSDAVRERVRVALQAWGPPAPGPAR